VREMTQHGKKVKAKEDLDPLQDLASRIEEHAKLIDAFVDLIPPQYYFPIEHNNIDHKFAKHKNQKAPKQEIKDATKKAKKMLKISKLDPNEAQTVTQLQKKKKQQEEDEESGEEEEDESQEEEDEEEEDEVEDAITIEAPTNGLLGSLLLSAKTGEANADELRKKINARIEELRKKRKADEVVGKHKDKQQKKKQKTEEKPKQTPPKEVKEKKVVKKKPEEKVDLQFGTFDFAAGKPIPTYLVNKKKSKKKSPEALLKEAEQLQELRKNIKGTEEEKKLVYKNLIAKAEGAKVKDNPKLLKKSIKKVHKIKEKKAKAWQERKEQTVQQQKDKQKQRSQNIKEHLQKKIDKKLSKKTSKAPSRAGFEGKKKDYINEE